MCAITYCGKMHNMPGGHFIDESTKMTNYQKKSKLHAKTDNKNQLWKHKRSKVFSGASRCLEGWTSPFGSIDTITYIRAQAPRLFFLGFLYHGARLNPVGRGPLCVSQSWPHTHFIPYTICALRRHTYPYIRETSPTIILSRYTQ